MLWRSSTPFFSPKLDWVQVAVSSYCNASCVYCPRTVYKGRWRNHNLSLETFNQLVPALSRIRLVFLQGWGEPFLNPDLFTMIRLAKQAGCQVGTTTNGMLLDDRIMTALVDMEVDLVAFSLAGTDEKNDVWRKGTHLTTVLKAARALRRIKEEKGKAKPEIHVAYMLLRSGMNEVLRLPSLLEGSGITQVVVSTLDFAASEELATEAIVPANERDFLEFLSKLDKLAESSKEYGLKIHHQLNRQRENQQVCSENVQRALVVSAYGEVSPCVFTNLPVSGVTFMSHGIERPYRRLAFGNVREDSLSTIWRRWAYLSFRNSFYEGNLASVCRHCSKL